MSRHQFYSLAPLAIALTWFGASWSSAQESNAALVRPYLEATTAIVAHANLQEVEGALAWAEKQIPTLPPALSPLATALDKQQRNALLATGVTDVYFTLALQDAGQVGVVAFVPSKTPAATKAFIDQLLGKLQINNYQTVVRSNLVIVANAKAIQRQIESTARADNQLPASLQACFESVATQPMALGVTVAKQLRIEVSQIWPDRLPIQLPIVVSPKQFMQDTQHVVASFNLKPAPKLALQVRSDSSVPASAERNGKLVELAAAGLEPYTGKLQVTRGDWSIQLVAEQVALESAIKVFAGSATRQASAQSTSNQMKQVLLAMHNYYSAFQYFPPRETRSADDKQLLSWRVHLLPFLAQQELYQQFHLDEPWDSPHNLKLAAQMPAIYQVAGDGVAEGRTRFVLPMIAGSAWHGDGPPLKLDAITDGTSATIAAYIAPASSAVQWTKPEEPALTDERLIEQMFGDQTTIITARFDGSVQSIAKDIDPVVLKALLTHQGGEVVQ